MTIDVKALPRCIVCRGRLLPYGHRVSATDDVFHDRCTSEYWRRRVVAENVGRWISWEIGYVPAMAHDVS